MKLGAVLVGGGTWMIGVLLEVDGLGTESFSAGRLADWSARAHDSAPASFFGCLSSLAASF